jgi:Phage integrase, N-terminal SAM-like domain
MTTKAITPLRQRMIEDMNSRKLCAHTQRGHIYCCKRLAAFLKRSPGGATREDLRLFQLHLAETGMSICNRNRIMTGVRFLFRVTLRRLDLATERKHVAVHLIALDQQNLCHVFSAACVLNAWSNNSHDDGPISSLERATPEC